VISGDVAYVNSFGLMGSYPKFDDARKQFDKDSNGTFSKAEMSGWGWVAINSDSFDQDHKGQLDQAEWDGVMQAENVLAAVRLDGKGDVTKSHVLWKQKRALPNVPAPVVYENTVYMVRDAGIFTSLDIRTGAVVKQERLRGAIDTYYSSPVAADGKIYVASEAGNLSVIQAGAQWERIGLAAFGEPINATPALADGRIFLRTASSLYCFGQKEGAAQPAQISKVSRATDGSALLRYGGEYGMEGGRGRVTIVAEGGTLLYRQNENIEVELVLVSGEEFQIGADRSTTFTFVSESDKVTGLKIKSGGKQYEFKKLK
jgi:outer membrane protein assembly factor BamB